MSDYLLHPQDLVREIGALNRNQDYRYINSKTHGFIRIINVIQPDGPIYFKRVDPRKGQTIAEKKTETISSGLLNRVAPAIKAAVPLNIDRLLGASYNNRSVFEALLAHTPYYYVCFPGRYDHHNGRRIVKKGHKHLIYLPNEPHQNGKTEIRKISCVISEHTSIAVHESVELSPEAIIGTETQLENLRTHIRIQNALRIIGKSLDYRTYIAKDNQSVLINDKPLGTLEGVVTDLSDNTAISHNHSAVLAGRLLDCVWFGNGSLMPAIFEVEHTTGITSGLCRMMTFWEHVKGHATRWVIVAPDEDKKKALSEISKPQFRSLEARYMPYSHVDELLNLAQRSKLSGIKQEFIDLWMEQPIFPKLPPITAV